MKKSANITAAGGFLYRIFVYCYCVYIKDTKEMRDRITDSEEAYYYCKNVKDTKEMADRITDLPDIEEYKKWGKHK